MPLRPDQRRPVPEWLAQLQPPEPDSLESCDFPLQDALKNSLYYPAAGFDGRPVQFLGGFIHSFIYVDYGAQEQKLENEVHNVGFLGNRVVCARPILPRTAGHRKFHRKFMDDMPRLEP